MAQETQAYKRSLSGSVGAGLNSVFNKGGRTYYILEHKVSSKYHRAGEAQEIIVDQIELGRDPKCQVQYDESFKTVSRRHAAIVRDGNNWKLIQLSQTNTTFLNGRPISSEWYLQNGDEIQLSVNGPKLGFIVPSGNKSTVGSIGLSRRLSLFRQQALKPYKTAMWSMAACIMLLLCMGIGYGVYDHKRDLEFRELTEQQIQEAERRHQQELADAQEGRDALIRQLKAVKADLNQLKGVTTDGVERPASISRSNTSNKSIASCEPNVYYVHMSKIVAELDGETKVLENIGSGTGFLLDDGRFVTARHVIEPWFYPEDDEDIVNIYLNAVANNGGSVVCYLDAYSPTGQHLSLVSTNAKVDRSSDKSIQYEGATLRLALHDASDYAYFRTSCSGGLKYNNALSRTLPVQAKLTILGYPMRLGAQSKSDVHPIYSEAVVAREGLEQGYILTTATTFEHGNSGGPVFATSSNGELIVVGIVSAGAGRSTGFVVPISTIQ